MGMRVAIFASGGGSNFQALVESAHRYQVPLLICNHSKAGALKRAQILGIRSEVISPRTFQHEDFYTAAMLELLHEERIELIALAGYLSKIPTPIIEVFPGRILNIHPSLLPNYGGKGFYGRRVHEAVIEAGDSVSGATVHIVDENYDTGPIVLQKKISVLADDTPDSLAARVLMIEHQLFPKAIHLFAEGRIKVSGRNVTITPSIHDYRTSEPSNP